MSGSTSFKFKKPINWAYAPGISKSGTDGSVGNPGSDGNAIYFIDYELNNSYNIELTQQKLENNFTLSGNSAQISEERKYHSGDIMISDKGNCYRIEKGDDSYYTFDVKYIGKIFTKSTDEVEVKCLLVIKSVEDGSYSNFVPNNRQYLDIDTSNNKYKVKNRVDADIISGTGVYPENDIYKVNGSWYKFLVVVGDHSIRNIDVEYSVEIRFKNEKTYNFNSEVKPDYTNKLDPTTDNGLYRFFKFNKILEFPSIPISSSQYNAGGINSDISDIKPVYISDMSLDKSHLFGNDIKHLVVHINDKTYCSKDGYGTMGEVLPGDVILQTHTIKNNSWPSNENTDIFVPAVYSTYNTIDGSITESDINWRGGESAYFSSCSTDKVLAEIDKFIKNADFNIIIHNKKTDEIKIVSNVPIEYNF